MIGDKKIIGVCLTKVNNRARAEYISGLYKEATNYGYKLMVFNSIKDFLTATIMIKVPNLFLIRLITTLLMHLLYSMIIFVTKPFLRNHSGRSTAWSSRYCSRCRSTRLLLRCSGL